MLQNIVVKNFRCFPSLRLHPLSRMNLIAGMNNTGKTSLLEAIHLHNKPLKCDEPVAINKLRGIADPTRAIQELCSWLFSAVTPRQVWRSPRRTKMEFIKVPRSSW
jgi:AAA ATPase domain